MIVPIPTDHIYAVVFDAYARHLEVLSLSLGDVKQTAIFHPTYKFAGKARFIYTIVIPEERKTKIISL